MRSDVTATLAVLAGLVVGVAVLSQGIPAQDAGPAAPAESTAQPAPPSSANTTRPGSLTPCEPLPSPPTTAEAGGGPTVRPGAPRRLLLPTIGVDTRVTPIHMVVEGALVPPADYTTAGWWAEGPAPGSRRGTAVITGHTVHTGGGVFDELGELRPGDDVIVVRRGPDLVYTVRNVRTLAKSSFARHADALFSTDTPGRLALVTCGGWSDEVYLSNIVVTAVRPAAVRS